jgi:hypothetical protein
MSLDAETLHRSTEWPFACECGQEFTSTVYHAVNITFQPRLLYSLLAGKLNVATCPNCGRKVASPLPFIYHDMRRGLFAYVHPSTQLDEDEREQLIDRLRDTYTQAVATSTREHPPRSSGRARRPTPSRPRAAAEPASPVAEPDAPPMQVIFGVDRLVALVESLLEPGERLGRIALSTRSANPSERERLVALARQMADQLECQVEAGERGNAYGVEIYGPRSQIGTLMSMLQNAL